ncbi:hypothetical protein PV326_010103, partial [Microctonus aethiopoides]
DLNLNKLRLENLMGKTHAQRLSKNVSVECKAVSTLCRSAYNAELNYTDLETDSKLIPDAFPVVPQWSQTYIGLVSGALTVLALLLTGTVFLMKLRGRNKVALLQKHTALLCNSRASGITINVKDMKLPTPIVVNGDQPRLSDNIKSSGKVCSSSITSYDATTINVGQIATAQHSSFFENEYEHRSVYAESTYKLLFPDDRTFFGCKTDYADVTDVGNETVSLPDIESDERVSQPKTPCSYRSSKHSCHRYSTSKCHKIHEGYYAATDILTQK